MSLGKFSTFTVRSWIHCRTQRLDFFTCFFDGSADLNDRFFDKILQFGGLHDLEVKFVMLGLNDFVHFANAFSKSSTVVTGAWQVKFWQT